jgi:hypothetical protein
MVFFANPPLSGGVPMEYLDAFYDGNRSFDSLEVIRKERIVERIPDRIHGTVMKVAEQNAILFKLRLREDGDIAGQGLLMLYECEEFNPEAPENTWKTEVIRYAHPVVGINLKDYIIDASHHLGEDFPFQGRHEALTPECIVKLLKNAYRYNVGHHAYAIELDA